MFKKTVLLIKQRRLSCCFFIAFVICWFAVEVLGELPSTGQSTNPTIIAAPTATPEPDGSDVTIVGIEKTLDRLQKLPQTSLTIQASLILQLVKVLGRKGNPIQGNSRLDYHITVDDAGHLIVNNQDLTALVKATTKLMPKK